MASRRGKPNMTPEQERTLLHLVAYAMYPAEAAKKIGLSPQAISMRKSRDAAFATAIAQSEASAEMLLLAQIMKAAQTDWRAALAVLERRWPERWARPELRAELQATNVDAKALTEAIHEHIARSAARHVPENAVYALTPEANEAVAPASIEPPNGVTRS